jgi:hypothetical protein
MRTPRTKTLFFLAVGLFLPAVCVDSDLLPSSNTCSPRRRLPSSCSRWHSHFAPRHDAVLPLQRSGVCLYSMQYLYVHLVVGANRNASTEAPGPYRSTQRLTQVKHRQKTETGFQNFPVLFPSRLSPRCRTVPVADIGSLRSQSCLNRGVSSLLQFVPFPTPTLWRFKLR